MLEIQDLSIYIHIPFCRTRCNYCDFNTYAGMESNIDAYIEALVKEISLARPMLSEDSRIHTIFFGGGTPSILSPNHFARMLEAIQKKYRMADEVEISTEANPLGLSFAYLSSLHELGIERLSMGMQSGNAQELKLLGRKHQLHDVHQSMNYARQAGFDNINLDLIFGIPLQTLASFQQSLEIVLKMQPEHLSIYSLTVEAGTPLERMISSGEIADVDNDMAADMYAWVMADLAPKGLMQYEISNWAREKSLRCRHNLQYWYNHDYLGFGAGAHSHYREKRWANTLFIPDYIQRLRENEVWNDRMPPAADEVLNLTTYDDIQETMMMGLRLTEEGVAEMDFQARFGQSLKEVYEAEITDLIEKELLERAVYAGKQVIRLTTKGRMLGNQVFMQFIDA